MVGKLKKNEPSSSEPISNPPSAPITADGGASNPTEQQNTVQERGLLDGRAHFESKSATQKKDEASYEKLSSLNWWFGFMSGKRSIKEIGLKKEVRNAQTSLRIGVMVVVSGAIVIAGGAALKNPQWIFPQTPIAPIEGLAGSVPPVNTPLQKRKVVCLVLPTETAAAKDMRSGFVSGLRDDQKSMKVRDEIVEIMHFADGPSPKDTINRLQKMELDYEYVLAVGHESSTLAHHVCQEFYLDREIPVILLGPTNPEITRDANLREKKLILRLLPTNMFQVKAIADFIQNEKHDRVVVACDIGNPFYSQSLTKQLATDNKLGPKVVATIEVSSTDSARINFDRLTELNPDVLVFVGMTEAARVVLRTWEELSAVKAGGRKLPAVIFTDGCATKEFQEFIQAGGLSRWGAIAVVSPMPADDSNIPANFDYEPLGRLAYALTKNILEESESIDRTAISTNFARKMNRGEFTVLDDSLSKRLRTLSFRPSSDRNAVPTAPGDNNKFHFTVYTLNDGIFLSQ